MTHAPWIEAMLRPEIYPRGTTDITLVQTHISYVFLAGSEVYKVKKPVRFSFLDFSTLDRRRQACHDEVRLNRRLAPDMYRGVVTICTEQDGYRFGEEEDPHAVEYAVQMRRLPAERILTQLLDRNEVTAEMIERLARHLADFHRTASCDPDVTANGDPSSLARILADNFAGARPFRGNTISDSDDDAIQEFCRLFLTDHGDLFRRRQQQHRIRDGHGDLHSEHICFGEQLEIFDCIEFNPAFRYCDVASEIAFIAMDLDYHGRRDLSSRLVERYAALTEDLDLEFLVPFYECYRAYVRGKVDSLKSAEGEVDEGDRLAARQSAADHFALAYRYTFAYARCLVAVVGLSGSGKTTVATALHQRTGFEHIRSDVVRKELAGLTPEARVRGGFEDGLYSSEWSRRTYEAMYAKARSVLSSGQGVILDATFQRPADRHTLSKLAKRERVPLLVVECRCRPESVRARLEERAKRSEEPSDADWAVYLEQSRRYERFDPDEGDPLLVLDTTRPTAESLASIERVLQGLPTRLTR